MTKKDYESIAREIRAASYGYKGLVQNEDFSSGARMAIRDIAIGMAEIFAIKNPRFDRDRFLTECGVR